MTGYDFRTLEDRWGPVWKSLGLFEPDRPERYVVSMFAYPSGDLHMGHAEAYAIGDAIARYWRLRGHEVLHPIGCSTANPRSRQYRATASPIAYTSACPMCRSPDG